jgi:hypothetical protein
VERIEAAGEHGEWDSYEHHECASGCNHRSQKRVDMLADYAWSAACRQLPPRPGSDALRSSFGGGPIAWRRISPLSMQQRWHKPRMCSCGGVNMKMSSIALVLSIASVGAGGCKQDPSTGLPVMDDPSAGEPGVDTVRPQVQGPRTSEYPKVRWTSARVWSVVNASTPWSGPAKRQGSKLSAARASPWTLRELPTHSATSRRGGARRVGGASLGRLGRSPVPAVR